MDEPQKKNFLKQYGGLILVCLAQAFVMIQISLKCSPTWDEWGQLPSGMYGVTNSSFVPYCVNPPLVRFIAGGITLIFANEQKFVISLAPSGRPEWELARQFEKNSYQTCSRLFFIGRLSVIAMTILGTYVIWLIIVRNFGTTAAIFGSIIWAFSPTVLTFGTLVVPDIPLTVLGLIATVATLHAFKTPTFATVFISSNANALALLCKTSWSIVIVAWVTFAIVSIVRIAISDQYLGMVRAGKLLLWIITFLFVIAAAYEFQGVFKPLGDYTFVSQALRGSGKEVNRFKSSFAARIPIPLPEHLVHGVDIQKKDFESKMPSYFLGEWRNYGWYEYYIVSWLIKEPPTFWLMITIGLFVSKSKFTREELFLHFPGLLIFAFVSSQTGFNHHLRYTLPVFPCFVILATRWIQPKISHLTMASLCVVLYVCSTMGVYPRTYAYFSEAVGGASQGWKYLGYSNLDWGQDVRTIYEWIDEHRELTPVFAFESTPYGRSLSPYDVKFAERYCVEKDGVLYPNAVGWWMIPNRAYIEGKSRWFRENEPSAMLSVTTRLYRIDQCRLDAIRAKYLSQSDAQP